MADPYYSYGAPAAADGASIARSSFAGYIPSEPSNSTTELRSIGSDYLQRDIGLFYSADDTFGSRVHSEPVKGYSPLADPDPSKKRDTTPLSITHGVPDVNSERPASKSSYDGLPISAADSNILFVGGLPNDCTRREVGHLFRPFIGYKDIRVVHKEPRRVSVLIKNFMLTILENSKNVQSINIIIVLSRKEKDYI
ncbi:RNA-binding protein 1 isoform B [Glycine soja]|uniref:RRM domain-containing protein n=2 Tax=Glycine subgen. Soja TaxID=1462606 RepID=K7KT93_SOYBN|nr:RNA-binding protein 1 isoform B [Glycine soja]